MASDRIVDRGRLELDRAGRQLRVLGARQAERDRPGDAHDELGADPAGLRVRLWRVGLVDDDLGDPVSITEVEEDQLAVIASTVDPAGEPRGRSGVARAELPGRVRAIGRGEAGMFLGMAGVS